MSLVLTTKTLRSPRDPENPQLWRPATRQADPTAGTCLSDRRSSDGFSALLSAYRSTGGTARAEDLVCLLEDHGAGNVVSLATLIASDAVFGFRWRGNLWIPMFQFELRDLSTAEGPRAVLQELGSGFDGWARAVWFVTRNAGLEGQRPVDRLAVDLPAVLDAARADRALRRDGG